MNYSQYRALHTQLVAEDATTGGHTEPSYIEYTRLNLQRIKRWEKQVKLTDSEQEWLSKQTTPIKWVVLTEPWCGDAAPSLPVIQLIAAYHPVLELEILLRDEHLDLMNHYLTDGAQSIPKLIQYTNGSDRAHAHWGPRPQGAAQLIAEYKAAHGGLDASARELLQQWYNKDKGQQIIGELLTLLGWE